MRLSADDIAEGDQNLEGERRWISFSVWRDCPDHVSEQALHGGSAQRPGPDALGTLRMMRMGLAARGHVGKVNEPPAVGSDGFELNSAVDSSA